MQQGLCPKINVSRHMNRLTILVDIAGRVALDTRGSARVTAAAVAVATSDAPAVRAALPASLPKWRDCAASDAERGVELLAAHSVSVGVISINKDTDAWRQFAADAEVLQAAILAESRRPAGWAKPANLLTFQLVGSACAIATGHGIRVGPKERIVDMRGLQLIECAVICDSDISGEENLEVFRSFWDKRHAPKSRLAKLGVSLAYEEARVLTEQEEPLLLLADYAAGIAHASLLPAPGRLPLPLDYAQSNVLLGHLRETGKLVMESVNFDASYSEIFGNVMEQARERAAC